MSKKTAQRRIPAGEFAWEKKILKKVEGAIEVIEKNKEKDIEMAKKTNRALVRLRGAIRRNIKVKERYFLTMKKLEK